MAKKPLPEDQLDAQAYARATRQFQLVQKVLPQDAVERLAQEVVRRLNFRMPRNAAIAGFPDAEQISRLCAALLSPDDAAGDRIILAARQDGASPEVIYLGYVAGAARRLGVLWEEDQVSFAEVTVASSRLYRIIRGLRHVLDAAALKQGVDRHVLFALVPEDTHTLGIEMATDLFRRDGWDVEMSVGEDHDQIVSRTENERFQSVVLVAHSESTLPNLISLVLALRITQPMAYIVVAGNIVSQRDDVGDLVGADDVIVEIETAAERLRAIIGPAT
jgi:methanogenic corrinoid protein MtbC1